MNKKISEIIKSLDSSLYLDFYKLDIAQEKISTHFTGVDATGQVWIEGNKICQKYSWNKGEVKLPIEHVKKEYRRDIFFCMLFNPETYGKYID